VADSDSESEMAEWVTLGWGYVVTYVTEVPTGTSMSRDHQTEVKSGSRFAYVGVGDIDVAVDIPS
jgi:hypothetical protein